MEKNENNMSSKEENENKMSPNEENEKNVKDQDHEGSEEDMNNIGEYIYLDKMNRRNELFFMGMLQELNHAQELENQSNSDRCIMGMTRRSGTGSTDRIMGMTRLDAGSNGIEGKGKSTINIRILEH